MSASFERLANTMITTVYGDIEAKPLDVPPEDIDVILSTGIKLKQDYDPAYVPDLEESDESDAEEVTPKEVRLLTDLDTNKAKAKPQTPASNKPKTKSNFVVDPTYVPGKDEQMSDNDGDDLIVNPRGLNGGRKKVTGVRLSMDPDTHEAKPQTPASNKSKAKKFVVDPSYVPGKDEQFSEEDEDGLDVSPGDIAKEVKTQSTKKKKNIDPTYLPAKDEYDYEEDFGYNMGLSLKRKLRFKGLDSSGDSSQSPCFSNSNKKKKLNDDPAYTPGRGDEDENEDGFNKPEDTKKDENQFPDPGSGKIKKKRDNDPVYVPGTDDEDEENPNGMPLLSGDSDDIATPKRVLRKRKRSIGTDFKGGQKKNTSPRTPKRQKRKLVYDPKKPLFPNLVNDAYKTPESPKVVIDSLTQMETQSPPAPSHLPIFEESHYEAVNPRRRSYSEPVWDRVGQLRRESDTALDSDRRGSSVYTPPPKPDSKDLSKSARWESDDDTEDDDEDGYLGKFSIPRSERKSVVFDFSKEKAKRWAEAIKLPEGLWSEAEKDLFFRLAMRGFEPVIPSHWQYDFTTLPQSLLSFQGDVEEPMIKAFRSSEFYAIKSLASLFSLGGRVRDCSILGIRPEPVIKATIKKYLRWALYDANVYVSPDSIPVHAIYSKEKGESTLHAVRKLNQQLETLAKRYRELLGFPSMRESSPSPEIQIQQEIESALQVRRRFPLLVGFVICGPIVAILTLDSDPSSVKGWSKGTGSKFISQFDLGEWGQDVWSSLAVAITIMRIRRTMFELAEEGEGGFCRFNKALHRQPDEDI